MNENDNELDDSSSKDSERVKKVLIVTKTRSGSTFFGDLLQSHPDAFYFFEPLYNLRLNGTSVRRNDMPVDLKVKFLRDLLECDFEPYLPQFRPYLKWLYVLNNAYPETSKVICDHALPNSTTTKTATATATTTTTTTTTKCYDLKKAREICLRSKIRVIKLVKLNLTDSALSLLETIPDSSIFYLLRDPRGVFKSRSQGTIWSWCKGSKSCSSEEAHCQIVSDEIKLSFHLEKLYPARFALVKYEELACNPYQTASFLFRFLGFPDLHDKTVSFIEKNTRKEFSKEDRNRLAIKVSYAYSTMRNSTIKAFDWMTKLNSSAIETVEAACAAVFGSLYLPYDRQRALNNCNCSGVVGFSDLCYPPVPDIPRTIVQRFRAIGSK